MRGIYQYLQEKEDVKSIIDGISSGLKEQLVAGLSDTARSLFVSTIHQAKRKKTLIVTHQLIHAQQLFEDLNEFSNNENVYLYPVNELIASEMAIASPELRAERIQSLTKWLSSDSGILIAPIAALKRILPPPYYWEKYQLTLAEADILAVDQSIASLVEMGYERVDMVTSPAEFSVRGGIIDIYPVTEKHPIRMELFDDEVDSIRYFDASTQRSLQRLTRVKIGPAKELLLTQEDKIKGAERLEQSLASALVKMKASERKETLILEMEHEINQLKEAEDFQEMYKYSEFFYENLTSLLDYVPDDGLIIFDEMSRIQEAAQTLDKEEAELMQSLLEQTKILPNINLSFDWGALREKVTQQRIYMSVFLRDRK